MFYDVSVADPFQEEHSGKTCPLVFASCRDCPSYLASAETSSDFLLPIEIVVHDKWLPAETVRLIICF